MSSDSLRSLSSLALVAMSVVALTGCPEDLGLDGLSVVNANDEPVSVDLAYHEDTVRSPFRLYPGESQYLGPRFDSDHCVQGDVIVMQRSVEIDRVEGPICVPEHGLTLRVGGSGENELRIQNATDQWIDVLAEQVTHEESVVVERLAPGTTRSTSPRGVPREGEGDRCTSGDLVAYADGVEIERFDPPICFDHGRTVTVDGRP